MYVWVDSDDNGYIDFVEFLIAVNITSHGKSIHIEIIIHWLAINQIHDF
jgi:Ca2+-binding EF-hand superfamily protein